MFISFLCVLEQLMKLYCRNSNFETYIKIQNSKRPEDNIRLDILFLLVHTDLVSGDSSPAGSAVRAVHQIFRGFGSIFSQILANQVQERIHKRRKQRRLEQVFSSCYLIFTDKNKLILIFLDLKYYKQIKFHQRKSE